MISVFNMVQSIHKVVVIGYHFLLPLMKRLLTYMLSLFITCAPHCIYVLNIINNGIGNVILLNLTSQFLKLFMLRFCLYKPIGRLKFVCLLALNSSLAVPQYYLTYFASILVFIHRKGSSTPYASASMEERPSAARAALPRWGVQMVSPLPSVTAPSVATAPVWPGDRYHRFSITSKYSDTWVGYFISKHCQWKRGLLKALGWDVGGGKGRWRKLYKI